MKSPTIYTVTILIVLSLIQICNGKIILISPQEGIEVAISNAIEGDTLQFQPGIYTGVLNKNITINTNGLYITSISGAENTIIDLENNGRAFNIEGNVDSTCLIEGLTFRNGNVNRVSGGAISTLSATPRLKNCIFENNYADQAGAIRGCFYSVENCIFSDNRVATHGGAMTLYGGCSTILKNCLFVNNDAIEGSAVSCIQSSPIFINCTFVKNKGLSAVNLFSSAKPIFENCILAFNEEYAFSYMTFSGDDYNNPSFFCTNISENQYDWDSEISHHLGQNGNISLDPLFCDIENNDFSISSDSPCALANNECGVLIGCFYVQCGAPFQCGDINGDGLMALDDVAYLSAFVFCEGEYMYPDNAGDLNNDDFINIVDVMLLYRYVVNDITPTKCLN
ncbi:MAG: hypothetical protein V3V99_06675 [candidate division Zixibacteria bacterium]